MRCARRHHKSAIRARSVRQTQLRPPTEEIHSRATQCASVRAAITPILRMKIGTSSHRRPVDFKLRFHGCRFKLISHAGLKEWSGQGKNGGGGGEKQKAEREQRKLWRRRGKRGQHQLRSCSPGPAQCYQTPAERMESRAPSLPKARARRGISKFSWLPWRDSPLTNGEQMRPFSR